MQNQNLQIRLEARRNGIPLREVAEAMQFSISTLYRRLQNPLTPEEKKKYLSVIRELAQRPERPTA